MRGRYKQFYKSRGIVDCILGYSSHAKVLYEEDSSASRNYRRNFREFREVLRLEPKYTVTGGIEFECYA